MQIIKDIDQLSDAWFTHRIGSVGGSSIIKLMAKGGGKTRKKLKYDLAEEIATGVKKETYVSDDMNEGTRREPESRTSFSFITDLEVEEIGLIKGDIPRTHCSPDGLTSDGAGLELKNPKLKTQIKRIDENRVPLQYIPQIQYSMWITGYEYWYFFSYYPGIKPLLIKVQRDEEYIKTIETETKAFLDDLEKLVRQLRYDA